MTDAATRGGVRVGVTGAGGFIGRRLVPALRAAGHDVVQIGRGRDADVHWDPAAGTIDHGGCAGIEAFVHLAGANVGERWTPARRRVIRDSREQGTSLIARTAATLRPRPRVLVCASAIGYYGDAGDAICDESTPSGDDFLAEISRVWEGAADPARRAEVRTVHLRFGVVLGQGGGALARMLPVFRLGAGGRLGSGRQWMSWLSLDDALGVIQFAMDDDALAGAVNAVAPSPVTNAEFTDTLARVLHRPAIMWVPTFALRLVYGEMAQGTLLASQRVLPRRLLDAGYMFRSPTLEATLRTAVTT